MKVKFSLGLEKKLLERLDTFVATTYKNRTEVITDAIVQKLNTDESNLIKKQKGEKNEKIRG